MNARFSFLFSSFNSRKFNHLFIKDGSYMRKCYACMKLQKNGISSTLIKRSPKEKHVTIYPDITVKEVSKKLNVGTSSIINLLRQYDYDTSNGANTTLDIDIAELIVDEFGFSVFLQSASSGASSVFSPRPPVVTIMGHVDHGKTTLLDYLRKTSVAINEAGGITQSIGAFSVKVPDLEDHVTFVDTPGHAAFNLMRARGAQLTDLVVLVIAADDGIMKQTKECLMHIQESNVPFVVAINKIDRSNANPDKVKRELLSNGVQLDCYGGDIKFVEISALKGTNVDDLLKVLNNFAKENPFHASHEAPIKAVIMEAENNKKKGIITSLLMKEGKLIKGKIILAGSSMAKVRQIFNASGEIVNHALPSDPVQIIGWRSLPTPGEIAYEVENEAEARNILKLLALDSKPDKIVHKPLKKAAGKKGLTQKFKSGRSKRVPYRVLLRAQAASGVPAVNESKELNVVIKADVSGSLEALLEILSKFHSDHMKLNVIDASVGLSNLTDLQLASSFNGIVYCFNTDSSKDIMDKAKELNVSLKHFKVIYKLLDDLKDEIEKILPSRIIETAIGQGDVLKTFRLSGPSKTTVAGCSVKEGIFEKSSKRFLWRVMRDSEIVHEGNILSLKRGTEDVSVVKQLSECGVVLQKFNDFQVGDKLLCVEQEEVKQTIEWNL